MPKITKYPQWQSHQFALKNGKQVPVYVNASKEEFEILSDIAKDNNAHVSDSKFEEFVRMRLEDLFLEKRGFTVRVLTQDNLDELAEIQTKEEYNDVFDDEVENDDETK